MSIHERMSPLIHVFAIAAAMPGLIRCTGEPVPTADDGSAVDASVGGTVIDGTGARGAATSREPARLDERPSGSDPGDSAARRYRAGPISPPPSCGDALTNSRAEECDDGDGEENGADGCTALCEARDVAAVPRGPGGAASRRALGEGRHSVAAGTDGFAVVTVSIVGAAPRVHLSLFGADGKRGPLVRVDDPSEDFPLSFANPVVAAIPTGGYAVAWTDYLADGDELGIALRQVSATGNVGPRRVVSERGAFSQYDPDIVWTRAGLVVAWVDDSSWLTAPDLRYRLFGENLAPLGPEESLAETDAIEANVALTSYEGEWAAAWRVSGDVNEHIAVYDAASEISWDLEPDAAPPAYDRPAIAPVGPGALGVLYSRGDDRSGSGIAEYGTLVLARLDAEVHSPEYWNVPPLLAEYPSDTAVSVSQPNLVALPNGDVVAGWRSSPLPGDPRGDDTWVKRIVRDGELTLSLPEQPSPRNASDQVGDQRSLALATRGSARFPMLVSAWDDYGRNSPEGSSGRDVIVQYAQVPLVREQDGLAWRRDGLTPDTDAGASDAGQEPEAGASDDAGASP